MNRDDAWLPRLRKLRHASRSIRFTILGLAMKMRLRLTGTWAHRSSREKDQEEVLAGFAKTSGWMWVLMKMEEFALHYK